MPAVLSAIFSAIYAAFANKSMYRDTLYAIFPAMEQRTNETMAMEHHHEPMPFGVSRPESRIRNHSLTLIVSRDMADLQSNKRDTNCWASLQPLPLPSLEEL